MIYDLLIRAARPLVSLAAPFNHKLRKGVSGRAQALPTFRAWTERRSGAPLVWLHAPSVGESLMTQAIVRALRAQMPGVQIAFTHFSPSADRTVERVGADVSAYLPWDTTTDMYAALQALRPAAIAFVRTEIWPGLVGLAAKAGIPTMLVNGVLAPDSSRLRPLARYALGPSYQRLAAVGAIDTATALRFERLGVARDRIQVTGDARFDQVWQRVQSLNRNTALLNRLRDPEVVTIVAGSTWPSDETRLLAAVAPLIAGKTARLIVAAHEPTEVHMRAEEAALDALGIKHARIVDVESSAAPLPAALVVDRVGVLADLYAIADLAYVGGAFQGSGVHSVVEPAALSVPVIFGPQHTNAAEAAELADAGGGFIVRDAAELTAVLSRLVKTTSARKQAGGAARAFVEGKLGAAIANATLIQSRIVRD
ncbi:MAG: glycosyltransferase N-terminal domain-containing protein [Gemmatimonadota bacterium]